VENKEVPWSHRPPARGWSSQMLPAVEQTDKNTPTPPEHEGTRGRPTVEVLEQSGGARGRSMRRRCRLAAPRHHSTRLRGSEVAAGQKIRRRSKELVLWVSPVARWVGPSFTPVFCGSAQQLGRFIHFGHCASGPTH
jgi:hypothetical protein